MYFEWIKCRKNLINNTKIICFIRLPYFSRRFSHVTAVDYYFTFSKAFCEFVLANSHLIISQSAFSEKNVDKILFFY